MGSPGTPTRAGFTFNGWFTAASGGSPIAFPHTHGQTASFTLYAQWTANALMVSFDSQGGSGVDGIVTVTGGQVVSSPGTPTRAGYTFAGWFTASSGGSAISFPWSHAQTADFTLHAQWSLDPSRTTVAPTTTLPRPTTTVGRPRPESTTTTEPTRNQTTTTVAGVGAGATTTTTTTTTVLPGDSSRRSPETVLVDQPVDNLANPILIGDQLPDSEPGNPIVIQTGRETTWNIITINRRVIQLRDDHSFQIAVAAADEQGNFSEVNERGAVVVRHGHFITVSGEGYQPGSEAVAWLFSVPNRLGVIRIDDDGTFSSRLPVDASVAIGEHTVQVNGLTTVGELRSVNLAVEILESTGVDPAQVEPQDVQRAVSGADDGVTGLSSGILVLLVGLAVLSVAGLLVSRRTRRLVLLRRRRRDPQE